MPVSPNNLQFSLSSEYLERLKEKGNAGESLGLTAKRILIAALDADKEETHSVELTALIDRITALEETMVVKSDLDSLGLVYKRITFLEERVTAIEEKLDQTIRAIAERHEQIEGRINFWAGQVEGKGSSPVKRPASPPPPPRRRGK